MRDRNYRHDLFSERRRKGERERGKEGREGKEEWREGKEGGGD